MGTVEENRQRWNAHDWRRAGEEWSGAWGSADAEWYGSLLPRVHQWLPAERVLEIAPGFGRWTQYLKHLATQLTIVDLAETCIAACRERFADASNLTFAVNDGRSLPMVDGGSVDFVFSFDSLVHVEADVVDAYLRELARILSPDGVAFLHHSNIGVYRRRLALARALRLDELHWRLAQYLGNPHWRGESMTAARFETLATGAGLQCRSQELIAWRSALVTDCLSVVTRPGSRWARPNVLRITNRRFPEETAGLAALAPLYHH